MFTDILNLNKHEICFMSRGGVLVTIPPCGHVATVKTLSTPKRIINLATPNGPDPGVSMIHEVPAVSVEFGEIEFPSLELLTVDPGDGSKPYSPYWLLVNTMVMEAAKAKNHPFLDRLLAPNSGSTAVRHKEGPLIGQVHYVTSFVHAGGKDNIQPIPH